MGSASGSTMTRVFHRGPKVPMAQYRRPWAPTAAAKKSHPEGDAKGRWRSQGSSAAAKRNAVWRATITR